MLFSNNMKFFCPNPEKTPHKNLEIHYLTCWMHKKKISRNDNEAEEMMLKTLSLKENSVKAEIEKSKMTDHI